MNEDTPPYGVAVDGATTVRRSAQVTGKVGTLQDLNRLVSLMLTDESVPIEADVYIFGGNGDGTITIEAKWSPK